MILNVILSCIMAFPIYPSRNTSPRIEVNLNPGWQFIRVPNPPNEWESDDLIQRTSWKVLRVNSEETSKENGQAQNILDGDPNTIWHTEWSNRQPGYPHEIVIDLGSQTKTSGIKLLPRQNGPKNGLPKTFSVWLSDRDGIWTIPVHQGTLLPRYEPTTILFPKTENGRYLRIQFTDSSNPVEQFMSMSEIALIAPTKRESKTAWQDQYNIAFVNLENDRFDLKPDQLESLKKLEVKVVSKLDWAPAVLPHAAHIEKLGVSKPWQGVSYYRRSISFSERWTGKRVVLTLEAAMQVSDVWLNGIHIGGRRGGYLPVVIDLTNHLQKTNELLVRLDNRDNPLVPPGKPTPDLDFLYWSGLYRNAYLTVTNPVHISNPMIANLKAGGGIYAFCKSVSVNKAVVEVRTHLENDSAKSQDVVIRQTIVNAIDQVTSTSEEQVTLDAQEKRSVVQKLTVAKPQLWSPDSPHLYNVETRIQKGRTVLDLVNTRLGLRRLDFSREKGFMINGKSLRLIGTNRHQEYPYIGNALSDNATYRDFYKIKMAGFNCVRLSHYPQSPAAMDACDELGILTIPCIAGWQFYNSNPRFEAQVEQDIRELIRRDRNHPCVMCWETSLNETYPPKEIASRWYRAAHGEFLAPDMCAVGDGAHEAPWDWPYNSWTEEDKSRPQNDMPLKPGYIREYGDYEFGGGNSTTRQPLAAGEKGNLQSAWNFVWSHNRNRSQWPWTMGDGTWVMFDYHRGYDDRVEYSGMSNVFRLPRYIYRFFQSQYRLEPFVFIASDWTQRSSPAKVVVFSNGEEVELWLNGKRLGRQTPDRGPDTLYGDYQNGGNPWDGGNCNHLVHPPFTFNNIAYEPGELVAVAKRKGRTISETIVRTPGQPVGIRIRIDESGRSFRADGSDVVFVYADVVDKNGTVCSGFNGDVELTVQGSASMIGPKTIVAEDGTATFLIQSTDQAGAFKLAARCGKLAGSLTSKTTRKR